MAVFFASQLLFTILVSAVIFLAISEYVKLSPAGARDTGTDVRRGEFLLVTVVGVVTPYLLYLYGSRSAMPLVVFGSFLFFLNGILRGRWKARAVSDEDGGGVGWDSPLRSAHMAALSGTLGIVYIAVPLSYLIVLRDLPSGGRWVMFLLTIIWLNDTCAFAAGKTIGRTKLCPEISPKKTVEGAVAGLAGGMLAGYAFNFFFNPGPAGGLPFSVTEILGLSLLIGAVGIIGDLAESLLKRSANVKDSGTIIPGHGGVLDRIDSLIFTIPLLYYYLIWRI